jgi:hypothetical protein
MAPGLVLRPYVKGCDEDSLFARGTPKGRPGRAAHKRRVNPLPDR